MEKLHQGDILKILATDELLRIRKDSFRIQLRIIHDLAFRPRQRHNAPDAFHGGGIPAFPGKQQFAFPDIEADIRGVL